MPVQATTTMDKTNLEIYTHNESHAEYFDNYGGDIGLPQDNDPFRPIISAVEDCRLEQDPIDINSQMETSEFRNHLALQLQMQQLQINNESNEADQAVIDDLESESHGP